MHPPQPHPPEPIDDEVRRWLDSLTHDGRRLVLLRDAERRTTYVGGNCDVVTGWPPGDFADRVYALVHPEDQQLLFDASRGLREQNAAERHFAARFIDPDGWYREYSLELLNRLDDPRVRGVVAILDPVERPADRADRWAGLLATTSELVLVMRDDLLIGYVSPNVERLLGCTADQAVRSWRRIVHPDDLGRFDTLRAEVARTPEGEARMRLRATHTDGGTRTFDVTFVNHFGDGLIEGLVVRARDVSDEAAAEHRMQRLLRDSSGAAYVVDAEGRVTWTTPGIDRFIGTHRMMTREVVDELFAPHADEDDVIAAYERVRTAGDGASTRIVGRIGPSNAKRWVDVTLTDASDDPALNGVIVNIRDVDEAVRASETGHRLTQVLESTTDLVCVFDEAFGLVWANAAAVDVIGAEAIESGAVRSRLPLWTRTVLLREALPALQTDGTWRGELGVLSTEDVEVPLEVTLLTHRGATGVEFVSVIGRDISHRKALESQLRAKARHDPLTGLPNRSLLSERLEHALRDDGRVTVLFLDLDQFKAVNDTQGHDAGDRLLVAAAERLRGALRPADMVARFGGDEFVILLPGVDDVDQARDLAERVLGHLRGPIRIGPMELFLTASAGVAVADGADASTLVSNADAAMYQAKANGRDQIAMFTADLRARTVQRLETAQELRSALDSDDELDVWFQPIIDTVTGVPISLEALARWIRPDGSMVATDHFVQVAEDTGLILPLGATMIRRACAAIRQLGDLVEPHSFSVNLSAHQLADPSLIDLLGAAVDEYEIRPQRLYCEVTESAVMADVSTSAQVLDQIRALGIGIAVDDFGTGYSSLAYLHRFPVDVLKIDREFVSGLTYDGNWEHSLAAGIISLAHSLGLTVVAEGVETTEQSDILRDLGCDAMQGYLFARPTPTRDLPGVLGGLSPRLPPARRTS